MLRWLDFMFLWFQRRKVRRDQAKRRARPAEYVLVEYGPRP